MKHLTIPELARELLQGDNYIMLTHRRPDGDTIGSAAALTRGLRALGKQAAVLENPQFTEKFRPYLEGLTVEEVPEKGTLVSVDIAAESLFSYSATDYVNRVSYLIDHHERNSAFAAMGHVDSSAAACGQIILELLLTMEAPVDKKTAEALYVAISTDTGCFRFSNVTAETLRAAAYCKDQGADSFAINQVMFMSKRLARLKLDAYLTEHTEFYRDGKVAVSAIPNEIRSKLGITEDDIDDISGFGREIEGVEVAVMLRQEGDLGKISLRCAPGWNASQICACMGGGGHSAAAGATVEGGIEAAKEAVLLALKQCGVL